MKFNNDSFLEALKMRGMAIAQPMTRTQYVAMLSTLGISGNKEQELAKYLGHHLGKSFIPTRIYNPTLEDAAMYQRFVVNAKVTMMHKRNQLRITPKAHLMHKHVR